MLARASFFFGLFLCLALPTASAAFDARHLGPVPGFVELTGDLRLHRFLEGYSNDPSTAAEAYVSMLVWRQRNDMDAVRTALANGSGALPRASRGRARWGGCA
jgi:hypothetical protein